MSRDRNRDLHLFRLVDGVKTPVIITVDKDMLILSEREAPSHGSPSGPIKADTVRGENGEQVVTGISAGEQEVLRFFTPNYECDSTPCKKLLEEYRAEVELAKKKKCKNCELGAIMRRYAPKVRALFTK